MKIGTSDIGEVIDFVDFRENKPFKHALVFFGGLEGIEGIIEQEEESALKVKEI